jgi:HSP20 family protein
VARIHFEPQDLPEDVRQLFEAVWREAEPSNASGAVECSPPLDVLETTAGIEVLIDLPGVPASTVRVVFSRGVLLVTGHKPPPSCAHRLEAAFHVAERAFGRFARIVRLEGSFDAERAIATLSAGELRVSVPRIDDRRGREIRIPVRA